MTAVIHAFRTARAAPGPGAGAAEPVQAGARAWVRSVIREPLFHFIVLGLLLWGAFQYTAAHTDRYTIEMSPAEPQRIAMAYQRQFGQFPTPEQLRQLIERRVREEIFLREGLALKLDQDDEIVRRRVVQKYEFLQTDLTAPLEPEATALERWFEENRSRYQTPEQVSFNQVYFSPDTHGEDAARLRALQVLGILRATHPSRVSDLGDSFPGPASAAALTPEGAIRLLGDSELSHALFRLPMGQWQGPFRSGYGWHLVQVTGHEPPRLPTLSAIHNRVLADYREEQGQLQSERAYEKLRSQYTVRFGKTG